AGDPVMQRSVAAAQPHGVDAVLEGGRGRKLPVRRGKAERTPELLTMRDLRFEGEAIAEQARSLRRISLLQQVADAAGGNDVGALVAERLDPSGIEAVPCARLHEKVGTALPSLA